jgi:hypothetical protein
LIVGSNDIDGCGSQDGIAPIPHAAIIDFSRLRLTLYLASRPSLGARSSAGSSRNDRDGFWKLVRGEA